MQTLPPQSMALGLVAFGDGTAASRSWQSRSTTVVTAAGYIVVSYSSLHSCNSAAFFLACFSLVLLCAAVRGVAWRGLSAGP